MASRFYFPSSGAPDISPAFGTGWNRTTGASRLNLAVIKLGTSKVERAMVGTAATPELHLGYQYVGPALKAQTITGTFAGVVMCWENNATVNGTLAVVARVVGSDGTHKAYLTSANTDAPVASTNTAAVPPEFVNTGAPGVNRQFQDSADATTITLTEFICAAGDRLVVEIGARDADTSTSTSARIRVGDNAGVDCSFDSTGSTDNDPWIEFSHTFLFQDDVTGGRTARRRARGR